MSSTNKEQDIDMEQSVTNTLAIFEEMVKSGFPIDVTQVEPGVLHFTRDGHMLEFDVMDIEAIKLYINTFTTIINQNDTTKKAPVKERRTIKGGGDRGPS